jgi:NADPH-dependent 2,4-dienoyl-CoA reductase/sulfur reductase-like enzyme
MSNLHVKYLLIGGGLASSSAAAAIREIDREGSVVLVGQEINRPYHRPPLSKAYLRREIGRSELSTTPAGWFTDQHVELRTGRRVVHLDTNRQTASLNDGEEITYDRALIAAGAIPLHLDAPGADLPNVFTLRTIQDADRLHNAIDKAKAEGRPNSRGSRGRVTVVGAGLLGVELAGSLTQLGLAVDLVAPHYPWNRFAGENTGKFLSLYLQKQGVAVHLDSRATRLEGDGRVQRVVLSTGETIGCDFAIAAVGAVANKELVRNTPIDAGRAILVDSHCRTSVPNVFAAGDCAAVLDPLFGKHRVLDHWDNAEITGRLAGRNMAGVAEEYSGVNRFTTKVFGVDVTVWGESRLVDHRLLRGTPTVESPGFAEIGIASDGRVAQVIAVGGVDELDPLRRLVAQRANVAGGEEQVKDPSAPLPV